MSWISITATIIVVIVIFWIVGIRKSFKVFFAPKEGESLGEKGIKTGTAAALYSAYHYWVVIPIAVAVVSILRAKGYPYEVIFVILWILNVLNGIIVLIVNDRLKKDITLQEGTQRVVAEVTKRKFVVGILGECANLIKLTFWDGPAELTIFLRERLRGYRILAAIIFFLAAGLQMVLWTVIYIKGYDSLSQIF